MDKQPNNGAPDSTQSNIRQQWSLLMDGELSDEKIDELLAKEDDLSTWQTYALIGDVLRSSDLATAQVRLSQKGDFLNSFKERLKEEPLIFAPEALSSLEKPVSRSWSRWGAKLAASGFAVMVVVGLVYGVGDREPSGPQVIATADGDVSVTPQVQEGIISVGVTTNSIGSQSPEGQQGVDTASSENILRDSNLDAYIKAHQRFSHNPNLFMPANLASEN